ncbi:hypothetical protein D3C81_868010 [compost metagenome]
MNSLTRSFTVLLLLFTLIIPTAYGASSPAAGSKIDSAKIQKISRLSLPIYDDKNNLYTLYIFASNEKVGKIKEDDHYTGFRKGQTSYSGTFQAALLKKGDKYAVVQPIDLKLSTLVLPDKRDYILKRAAKNTPDMFIMMDYGTSNFDLFRAFIVKSGKLQVLTFADKDGNRYDQIWGASRINGIRSLPGAKIQTNQYDNSKGKYVFDTFALNLPTLTLRRNDSSYGNSSSWKQAGPGDRAYLTLLKKAALQGILPGNPKIKLGMKAREVRSVLGNPKDMTNGEWHGYYQYNTTFVGFDGYVHELSDTSVVTELLIDVEKMNLTVSHVKNWLGKPSDEYVNEEEGNYVVIYNLGSRGLVFYSDDENSFITQVSIF